MAARSGKRSIKYLDVDWLIRARTGEPTTHIFMAFILYCMIKANLIGNNLEENLKIDNEE